MNMAGEDWLVKLLFCRIFIEGYGGDHSNLGF